MPSREWGRNPAESLNLDRREPMVRDEEHVWALKKAREVLAENAMNRNDFADLYGADVIAEDSHQVDQLRAKFEQRHLETDTVFAAEKAEILQAIVHQNGARWLGDPKAVLYRTDLFDDYVNGIDEIIGFPLNGAHSELGLSLDVTFANSLETKISGIVNSIRRGEPSVAKYVRGMGFRGEIVVPKVILAAQASHVTKMQHGWVKPRADLGQHAFRHFMLEELTHQTRMFGAFAEQSGQKVVASLYGKAHRYLTDRQRAIGHPSEEVESEIREDPMMQRLKKTIEETLR